MHIIGDIVECVQSYERGPSDRHTLFISKQFGNMALSQLVNEKSAVGNDLLFYNLRSEIAQKTHEMFVCYAKMCLLTMNP